MNETIDLLLDNILSLLRFDIPPATFNIDWITATFPFTISASIDNSDATSWLLKYTIASVLDLIKSTFIFSPEISVADLTMSLRGFNNFSNDTLSTEFIFFHWSEFLYTAVMKDVISSAITLPVCFTSTSGPVCILPSLSINIFLRVPFVPGIRLETISTNLHIGSTITPKTPATSLTESALLFVLPNNPSKNVLSPYISSAQFSVFSFL